MEERGTKVADLSDSARRRLPSTSWRANSVVALTRKLNLERVAVPGVVLLSFLLEFVALDREGYGNTYYAAAVKSMILSWHNFFFVAFDPAGFLAVDKPPLGFWIQAASAKLFGFSGVSLLLPQALATAGSVVVLYLLVSRSFGGRAGMLAALALAVTPIAVVVGRNNTPDALLILALLLAVWATLRAIETRSVLPLLLSAVCVGAAFNIKELQAYLILPALVITYFACARLDAWTRIWHLAASGAVLLVTSFWWIVAVDLTPAGARPYVTNSGTNSELSLALGYNGLGRVLAGVFGSLPTVPFLNVKIDLSIVPGVPSRIGDPGPLRLFDPGIAEQVSWLLPVALIGLGVAVWRSGRRFPPRGDRVALCLWGTWLLSSVVFFSVSRFYHLYYLIMVAPSLAAVFGIGVLAMWNDFRESLSSAAAPRWKGWALPASIFLTAVVQANVLWNFRGGDWHGRFWPVVACLLLSVVGVMLAARQTGRERWRNLFLRPSTPGARVFVLAGTLSLFFAPLWWSGVSVAEGNGGVWLPQAGPNAGLSSVESEAGFPLEGPGGGAGGALTYSGTQAPSIDPNLTRYLRSHMGRARYLIATTTSTYASLFILQTGLPAMALGGYQGWDRIVSPRSLARMVSNGSVRYFLLPLVLGPDGRLTASQFTAGPSEEDWRFPYADVKLSRLNDGLALWVVRHCSTVPPQRYGSLPRMGRSSVLGTGYIGPTSLGRLYDCAGA